MILVLLTFVKASNFALDLASRLVGNDLYVMSGLLRCRHAYEPIRDSWGRLAVHHRHQGATLLINFAVCKTFSSGAKNFQRTNRCCLGRLRKKERGERSDSRGDTKCDVKRRYFPFHGHD